MRILVFGASGRTGKFVLSLAKERNIEINAVVRDPSSLSINWPGLSVFEGTSLDAEVVNKAIEGCDAVLSCLNLGRTSDNPFAKLTAPENLLSGSITNALAAMEAEQVKRIAIMSAWGVGEQIDEIPWLFKMLFYKTNTKYAYADHDRQEKLVQAANCDWSIARPVALTNKENLKSLIISKNNNPKPKMSISRKHVAKFLLDSIQDQTFIGEVATLSEG